MFTKINGLIVASNFTESRQISKIQSWYYETPSKPNAGTTREIKIDFIFLAACTRKNGSTESQKVFHCNKTVTIEVSRGCGRAARAQCKTKSQQRAAAASLQKWRAGEWQWNGGAKPDSLAHLSPTIKAAQNQYMHGERTEKNNKKVTCLISAILVPALPMMQPMSSLGTVISWVWVCEPAAGRLLLVRSWLPAKAASAVWPNTAISSPSTQTLTRTQHPIILIARPDRSELMVPNISKIAPPRPVSARTTLCLGESN